VLPVVRATEEELAAHEQRLAAIEKAAGFALWRQMEAIEA
jgi:DNA polymerase-3 subunit epsilon